MGNILGNKTREGNADSIVYSLSNGLQKPFTMFSDGYYYDEVATEMNIPIGTVKSRIFFARKKLKGMVNAQYGSIISRRAL